jgi:hypothetical protein
MKKDFTRRELLKDLGTISVTGLAGGLGLYFGAFKPIRTRERQTEQEIPENILVEAPAESINIPEAPVYSESKVPANYCSRYVRFAARDLFGKTYPKDDAWNLRNYKNVEAIRLNNNTTLQDLTTKKVLTPGDVLGMFYPKSRYNGREDVQKAGYTHVVLFLGKENRDLYFADKFGSKIRKTTLTELEKENGLTPKEILQLKR